MAGMGWHLVRFTLVAETPLSCGAGEGLLADNAIARDAMGLPMIPGATLQGLLRRELDEANRDALFGCAKGNHITAGRILCGNGVPHGADNYAVQLGCKLDALLLRLQEAVPLKREHVRLDHRHGADSTGKFDRAAVPKGTRFSFEWLMYGAEADMALLSEALAPLTAPWFRVGSSGARGYGRIKLEAVHHGFFGKDEAEVFVAIRQTPLSEVKALKPLELPSPVDALTITISLQPVNPWRSGQDGFQYNADGDIKLTPVREPEIVWKDGKGTWCDPEAGKMKRYVLAGSALRGPLAHRAVFHWNRLNGQWAAADLLQARSDRSEEMKALFGFAREGVGDEEGGLASALLFEDVALEVEHVVVANHVKIDRFTGGSTPKALFSEEVLETRPLTTQILIRGGRKFEDMAREALVEALSDLCAGRLALGAKSQGYFKDGDVAFAGPDAHKWQAIWQGRRGVAQQ